jgi:hypothetical protein
LTAHAARRTNRQWRSAAWGTVICLAWTAPCRASESLAGLLACRDLADSAARLACFDRAAAALAASPTTSGFAPPLTTKPASASPASTVPTVPTVPAAATPAVTASTKPVPALNPQQQFGLPEHAVAAQEVAAGTRAADVTKIAAHLVRIAPTSDGRLVFTLDNDQVWRQLLQEADLLAKQGDAVTISRGLLGSYWLQIKSGRGCKVTRLR